LHNGLKKNCKKCLAENDTYKFLHFIQKTRLKKFTYKAMINYSDAKKTVVVSFAGPSIKEHKYITLLYSRGFTYIKFFKNPYRERIFQSIL